MLATHHQKAYFVAEVAAMTGHTIEEALRAPAHLILFQFYAGIAKPGLF